MLVAGACDNRPTILGTLRGARGRTRLVGKMAPLVGVSQRFCSDFPINFLLLIKPCQDSLWARSWLEFRGDPP